MGGRYIAMAGLHGSESEGRLQIERDLWEKESERDQFGYIARFTLARWTDSHQHEEHPDGALSLELVPIFLLARTHCCGAATLLVIHPLLQSAKSTGLIIMPLSL